MHNIYRFLKNKLPSILIPNALDEERKKYLFKEIRGLSDVQKKEILPALNLNNIRSILSSFIDISSDSEHNLGCINT